MHQLVEDELQVERVLEVLPGEGRRQQQERCEVQRVAVESVTASHADAWKTNFHTLLNTGKLSDRQHGRCRRNWS